MVAASKVVEDTGEEPREIDRAQRWGWLTAGLVVGAGISVLFLRVDAPPTPAATTVVEADTRSNDQEDGIGEVVEGFPDGLVAATRSDGQSLELLIWPLRGEPYERTIPVGVSQPPDQVAFDVAGRRIATLIPVPGGDQGVLYSGIPENAAIIATDVTGYAWHDTASFQLAYTTMVESELLLWTVRHNRAETELVARAVGIEGRLAAWGDWGFAVQDEGRDRVVLFTENGEIKDTHPGRVLDSHGSGWLAIANDNVSLLSAGGGVSGLESYSMRSPVLAGRFSDDREQLALLTTENLGIVALADETSTLEMGGRPGVPQLTWSSDGRFVLYPGAVRGMWVIDTQNDIATEVMAGRTFTGLGITPVGDS